MPKVVNKKFQQRPDKKDGKKDSNATATASAASAASRAFGPLFNKDLGQHILKNPLVAQGIVDKVQRFFYFSHSWVAGVSFTFVRTAKFRIWIKDLTWFSLAYKLSALNSH